jgi:anti-sigma factor RsiW
MDCRRIESLLPPYVDGVARASEIADIERHLADCAACRSAVAAQRTARIVLQARGREIAPLAPPGVRTRLQTLRSPARTTLGWRGRLSAFATAAALFLAAVVIFELVSPRSSVLYAAQLAIDHVRCFVVEKTSTQKVETAGLERQYAEHYGWQIRVPASNDGIGLRLVAARRCPFWVGRHAHVLYRAGESEVSLYIDRGDERADEELHVLGHSQTIWHRAGSSYALIARGVPEADLRRIAAYLKAETERAETGP